MSVLRAKAGAGPQQRHSMQAQQVTPVTDDSVRKRPIGAWALPDGRVVLFGQRSPWELERYWRAWTYFEVLGEELGLYVA